MSAGVAGVATMTVKCSRPGAVHTDSLPRQGESFSNDGICACSQTNEGESGLRVSAQHLCEPQAGSSIKLLARLSACVFTVVFIRATETF